MLTDQIEVKYFRQLDGFRFFSIMAVMLAHFADVFFEKIPLGLGVLFFFVLSSFLITRILLHAKLKNESFGTSHYFSLKQFYVRRFLRIFPIYYLLIFLLFVINLYPCRQVIIWLLTYTTNFKLVMGGEVGVFSHLWSLAVEEQFYIIFPFVVLFVPTRYLIHGLVLITFTGVVARSFLYLQQPDYIPYSAFHSLSCLDSLGIGGILGYMSIYSPLLLNKIIRNRIYFALSVAAFLLCMIISYSWFDGSDKFNFVSVVLMRFLFNIMSFWILGYAINVGYSSLLKRVLENSVVVYLGRISYGLYLYHLFVPILIEIFLRVLKIQNHFTRESDPHFRQVVVYILLTIAIGSLSWFIIEKPLNSLKKKFEYNKAIN